MNKQLFGKKVRTHFYSRGWGIVLPPTSIHFGFVPGLYGKRLTALDPSGSNSPPRESELPKKMGKVFRLGVVTRAAREIAAPPPAKLMTQRSRDRSGHNMYFPQEIFEKIIEYVRPVYWLCGQCDFVTLWGSHPAVGPAHSCVCKFVNARIQEEWRKAIEG